MRLFPEMILAGAIAAAAIALCAACSDDRPCLRYGTQQVATYPYAGFAGTPGMQGMAWVPVMQEQTVCVERASK